MSESTKGNEKYTTSGKTLERENSGLRLAYYESQEVSVLGFLYMGVICRTNICVHFLTKGVKWDAHPCKARITVCAGTH